MKGYGQFCPIAKAAEIVAEKWSIIIIREILAGSRTFNALRKGIPLISPTLLSRRLVELEDAHIIKKLETGKRKPKYHYLPDSAAIDLGPILMQLGDWGNKWAVSDLRKEDYDPRLLMWDISRGIEHSEFDDQNKYVVRFDFQGTPRGISRWWLVISREEVDVCLKDPGHEVNLYVKSHIKLMTEVWMGWVDLPKARRDGLIQFDGLNSDVKNFSKWFKLNVFARRDGLA
jgi:DNA-binding HxlR family transcriptional regulator